MSLFLPQASAATTPRVAMAGKTGTPAAGKNGKILLWILDITFSS